MYIYVSIYKDLQAILFRKKQIVEKYVSYDTIYIKTNNKYYPVFVHTHRIIYSNILKLYFITMIL